MDMNFIHLSDTPSFCYTDCASIFSSPYLIDSAKVIDSTVTVFKKYFKIPTEPLFIINNHPDFSVPLTAALKHCIFLTVSAPPEGGGYWSQFVYQFSHEFCHYLIFHPVPGKFRWLEESICELASHFFLLKVAEHWAVDPPYEHFRSFAPCHMAYELDIRKCDSDFSISSLFIPHSKLLESLEHDEYQRQLNRNIALKLLPFFIDNPNLWNIIHYLPDLSVNNGLLENMQFLQDTSKQPICDIMLTL